MREVRTGIADVAKDALNLDVVVAAVLFVGLKWLIAQGLCSSSFKSCDRRGRSYCM